MPITEGPQLPIAIPTAPVNYELNAAIDQALARERIAATQAATIVRLTTTLAILGIIFTRWRSSGGADFWARMMIPVSVYVVSALTLFILRRVPAALRLAWFTGLIDIAAVAAIFFQEASGDDTVSNAFPLGFFALLVATSALTLQRNFVFVTAAASSACEIWLLRSAHAGWGYSGIAVIVLFAVGAATQVASHRLRAVVEGLARTEVARRLAGTRLKAMASENERIATELYDTQAQNDALVALQHAKEGLAQVLVHDLRSPVTAVMASLDFIRQELEFAHERPDLQRSAADAVRQAERLTSMINDLLDVARLEEGRLKPLLADLSAADLCQESRRHSALLPRIRKLKVEVESDAGLRVEADRKLLVRILDNLLGNAVRFAETRVRLTALGEGNEVVFRVQNDGPPINPLMRKHLFEKFAQLGRTDGGWGLGLYFCRLAAEVHGGSVSVESDDQWNVSFVLRLPSRIQQETLAA
jgi:signal transduction histidine kinase